MPREAPRVPAQLAIIAPDGSEINAFGSAISPDGKSVAFVATTRGARNLWLRPLTRKNRSASRGPTTQCSVLVARRRIHRLLRLQQADAGRPRFAHRARDHKRRPGSRWRLESPRRDSLRALVERSPAAHSRRRRPIRPSQQVDPKRREHASNFPQFLPGGKRFLVFIRSSDPEQTGTYVGTLDDANRLDPIPGLLGVVSQAVYAPSAGGSRLSRVCPRPHALRPALRRRQRTSGGRAPGHRATRNVRFVCHSRLLEHHGVYYRHTAGWWRAPGAESARVAR